MVEAVWLVMLMDCLSTYPIEKLLNWREEGVILNMGLVSGGLRFSRLGTYITIIKCSHNLLIRLVSQLIFNVGLLWLSYVTSSTLNEGSP